MNKHYNHPLHLFVFITVIVSAASLGTLYVTQQPDDVYALSNFGGTIQSYTPVCVLDTACDPITGCTLCGISCPACSLRYLTACGSQSEILFSPAPGSAYSFICPPSFQQYRGGIPRPGGQILGNGLQNAPLQVGVSP